LKANRSALLRAQAKAKAAVQALVGILQSRCFSASLIATRGPSHNSKSNQRRAASHWRAQRAALDLPPSATATNPRAEGPGAAPRGCFSLVTFSLRQRESHSPAGTRVGFRDEINTGARSPDRRNARPESKNLDAIRYDARMQTPAADRHIHKKRFGQHF